MKKKEVIKHSSAIHISNEVNLLQRRAWNIMLAQAYNDLPKEDTYSITVRELCNALGYKGNNDKYIKQLLRELVGITVEWNVLGKDGAMEWGASSLLAEVKIINGVCHYAYGPTMRSRLYNPSMYARISLSLQNQFKSKHSLALYELFVDYFDAKRHCGETPVIGVEDFRHLLGLQENEYAAFKDLNKSIIKKALKEINAMSDLHVDVEYRKQGRSVIAVKFFIKPNPNRESDIQPLKSKAKQLNLPGTVLDVDNLTLYQALVEEFGISVNRAAEILRSQDEFYIEEVLEHVRTQVEEGKVKNVAAFTVKAISDDYRAKKPHIEEAVAIKEQEKEAQRKKKAREEAQESARREEQGTQVLAKFEKLDEKGRAKILKEFRTHLEEGGHGVVVKRLDAEGVSAGMVEAMLKLFLLGRGDE